MRVLNVLRVAAVVLLGGVAPALAADDDFDGEPIRYRLSEPANRVSQLQASLDRGEQKWTYDENHGYLPAVLKALNIPVESQMLVFSKTSLQARAISVRTPRAIYFNDEVYVGFCVSGDVLEISAVDPRLGAVFYTLDQQPSTEPRFERRIDHCLICHSSSRTGGVPGHLVRSLFVGVDGHPLLSAGGRVVDHTTPLDQRWGGWYVTGRHGAQAHLGNLVIRGRDVPRPIDNTQGHNVLQLNDRLDIDRYLTPHSDIVALMILEHQTLVHNRLTKANFATRQALDDEAMMNRSLGQPPHTRLDSTTRRVQHAADDLIDALLMVGEAPLTAPMTGTSGYAEHFSRLGLRDRQGRSLRDLELTRRMFKYPCSYLIDSPAFDALPPEMLNHVGQRLEAILVGRDRAEKYAHLSAGDRQAILEILRDTKPQLTRAWRATP